MFKCLFGRARGEQEVVVQPPAPNPGEELLARAMTMQVSYRKSGKPFSPRQKLVLHTASLRRELTRTYGMLVKLGEKNPGIARYLEDALTCIRTALAGLSVQEHSAKQLLKEVTRD